MSRFFGVAAAVTLTSYHAWSATTALRYETSLPPWAVPQDAQNAPATKDDKSGSATIKPLTAAQQEKLLAQRVNGRMADSFNQNTNMFLAMSRIDVQYGVGLMTSSKEIAGLPLQSPFPQSYRPTLREFLDAIALQTRSDWKYDPSSKYLESHVEHDKPVDDLAMFEFTASKRKKPFEITIANGWKSIDKGNWVMFVPPTLPVGLDIYEMGTYSCDDKGKRKELLNKVRHDVALEWAQRVSEAARKEDLKSAKVGSFDALFFEAMVDSQLDKKMRWRHWVFMDDDKCYFVVSTILPEFEGKVFLDVEKMLSTFKVKKQ
jgi:hypothetical protein